MTLKLVNFMATFVILPYLDLAGPFTLNGYRFMPFRMLEETGEAPVEMVEIADKIRQTYIKFEDRSDEHVTFVYPAGQLLGQEIAEEELGNLVRTVKTLFTGYFFENSQWGWVTSDNFEPVLMNYDGSGHIALQGGSIHRVLSGGHTLEGAKTMRPSWVNNAGQMRPLSLDRRIGKMIEYAHQTGINNVVSSMLFFFEAYKNNDSIPTQNRLTNLYLAFTTLLQIPSKHEREALRDAMVPHSHPSLPVFDYPIVDTITGAVKYPKELTLPQIWAEEFYKLRCKIFHGDELLTEDYYFRDITGNKLVPEPTDQLLFAGNIYTCLLFNTLYQHLNNPDYLLCLRLAMEGDEVNPTGLGYDNPDFRKPFLVVDCTMGEQIRAHLERVEAGLEAN